MEGKIQYTVGDREKNRLAWSERLRYNSYVI